jgi:hypothetical protein
MIGRLAPSPSREGREVVLRLVVTYRSKRQESTVLPTGSSVKGARRLKWGALVYVVCSHAAQSDEHEIEAPHVLALTL